MLCDGWQAFGRQKVEPDVEETPAACPPRASFIFKWHGCCLFLEMARLQLLPGDGTVAAASSTVPVDGSGDGSWRE